MRLLWGERSELRCGIEGCGGEVVRFGEVEGFVGPGGGGAGVGVAGVTEWRFLVRKIWMRRGVSERLTGR